MRLHIALPLAFLLLFFGCIEQAQQLMQQPQQNQSAQPVFQCPDGTNASSAAGCSLCSSNCSDSNPCTKDACDPSSGTCSHLPLDGPVANCIGNVEGASCMAYSCVRGTCSQVRTEACCGDARRSPGETCSTCPSDVKCNDGETCCPQGCAKPECSKDSDCDDLVLGTKDACSQPGTCNAKCVRTPINSCENNDSICPFGCSVSTDSDCKVQTTGAATYITNDFIVSFANPHLQECKIVNKSFMDDFIVFDVTFENLRDSSYPVFISDFYARSATYMLEKDRLNWTSTTYYGEDYGKSGDQHPSLRYSFPAQTPLLPSPSDYEHPCSSSERFSSLIENANVQKGQIMQGKAWVKVGMNGGYEKGSWTLGYTPKLDTDHPIEAQIYVN